MKKILKEYAKAIIVVAILVIVCDFLVALPPYIVKQVVDIDFTRKDISQVIVFFIFIYTSIHLARLIVKYIRDFMINEVICKILKDIRKTLFDKILRFKMITFNKYNSSELYTRLTSDVNNLFTLFFGFLYGILNNVLYIIFMIIMMFVADINVAVIGAFIVVLISSIVYKFTKILGKLDNEILEKRDLEHKEFSELYNKNKLTYLFKFSEEEALRLASYARYSHAVYLALYILTVSISLKAVFCRFSEKIAAVITFCIILLCTPMEDMAKLLFRDIVRESIDNRAPYLELSEKIRSVAEEGDYVYLICQD